MLEKEPLQSSKLTFNKISLIIFNVNSRNSAFKYLFKKTKKQEDYFPVK